LRNWSRVVRPGNARLGRLVSGVLRPQHMTTKIFVNLPVKDLDKSMAFFKAVGFKNVSFRQPCLAGGCADCYGH